MLKKARSAAFLLCLGLAFCADALYAQERESSDVKIQQQNERLRQEAIGLFSIVLNGKLEKLGRCQISSRWLSLTSEEWDNAFASDAKKYLGVKAPASFFVSNHNAAPVEILDPEGLYAKLFCDKAGTEANDKRRFVEFKDVFASNNAASLTNTQWSYAFPVFNEDYTRAAVIVQVASSAWWDPLKTGKGGGAVTTEIYEKQDGTWVLLAESRGKTWIGIAPPISAASSDDR